MSSLLISALQNAEIYPHPTHDIELIETHISWIILTGMYAYKIKKPVDFGFLDFTSLALRKQYCEAELSLNHRSAPDLYLGLVTISGTPDSPKLSISAEPQSSDEGIIEYAVRMQQFERGQLFSELCQRQQFHAKHVDALVEQVAEFHQDICQPDLDRAYGLPEQVYSPMQQNFSQISALLHDNRLNQQPLQQLEAWTESSYQRLKPLLLLRKQQGFVRNCHGDLHLGNITLFRQQVTLFDCIEFNEDFRWIDVISDIAFLVMDFEVNELNHFAQRFLNGYLEHTGDYAGLQLLQFYKVYRAIVRAKVALLSMQHQPLGSEQAAHYQAQYQRYIDLAESYTGLPNRFMLTMHGISGTGKSTVALRLVERLGAIRIRSDVERKRLFKLKPNEHPKNALAESLYSATTTQQTYQILTQLSAYILDAGLSVIIDATNLKHWQRQCLQQVADQRGVPLAIAYCQASMSVIKEWIQKRMLENQDASDADISTVERQIHERDALDANELRQTFVIHSNILDETNELVSQIKKRYL